MEELTRKEFKEKQQHQLTKEGAIAEALQMSNTKSPSSPARVVSVKPPPR